MIPLPDADELFLRYLDPWYTDAERQARSHKAIRPDMVQDKALAGRDPNDVAPDETDSHRQVISRIDAALAAARVFWPQMLGVAGSVDLSWIDAFDQQFDRKRVEAVIASSSPADPDNEYLRLCTEFGAVLAHVLRHTTPGLVLWTATPVWECALLEPRKGILIPTFHWAVKKLSHPGVDDGLTGKIEACMGYVIK